MQEKKFSIDIGGKTLTAFFSDLTLKANGSVILKMGETVVLATAVMSKNKKDNVDYFPLVVDYEEKFYARGEILGGKFMKREGKPTDNAILSGRMIDRTIRPLFDQRIRNDIQIIITILSLGKEDPDILAINAASLALSVSDIPWNGPISAVRIGKNKNQSELVINPSIEKENQELEIIVSGKDGAVSMIEASALEVKEEEIIISLTRASKEIEKIQEFQKKIVAEIGKKKKELKFETLSKEAESLFIAEVLHKIDSAIFNKIYGNENIKILEEYWIKLAKEKIPQEKIGLLKEKYEFEINKAIHEGALKENRRSDGRGFEEIREIYAGVGGISEVLHGTGIFYRGETHVLSVLTLGGPSDFETIDGIEEKGEKLFMHHYNFPPFSSGDTGRVGSTNRREVGHGALAERALEAVLPNKEDFPYTIRVVSESMSSNGSTSMASICASTLALMDGGVPIKNPVAGIAVGLMYETQNRHKILLDIQGPEDRYGDMDFKVAGSKEGITAIQLDIKVESVPLNIISQALVLAKAGREKILEKIQTTIRIPRQELSKNAPRVKKIKINPEKIGQIIGPGGKTIKGMKEATGAKEIIIGDNGEITVIGKNDSADKVIEKIKEISSDYTKRPPSVK